MVDLAGGEKSQHRARDAVLVDVQRSVTEIAADLPQPKQRPHQHDDSETRREGVTTKYRPLPVGRSEGTDCVRYSEDEEPARGPRQPARAAAERHDQSDGGSPTEQDDET